ncbi:sigma-70 family RNA polymerase sigma factor [Lachnospiraceae bacterium YH-ros2228]|nr:FliA/WhiG family RNA polymerase sigma factor [Lachnospiraceae bacterium]MDD6450399.1 FliA/WhiG family RNA polymerase sigma factor [Lachnospiraceae bacterium]
MTESFSDCKMQTISGEWEKVMSMDELKEKTNEELFDLYRKENDEGIKQILRQELTLRYLFIVKAIAYQMRDLYISFTQPEDIINEGVLEIMKGIDRYDPARDNKFDTFISQRIRGMVIDLMRKNDWMPRNFHRDRKNLEEIQTKLTEKLGRAPTDEEVAAEADIDIKKLRKIRSMSTMVNVLSLDMTYDDTDEAVLQVPTEDEGVLPEASLMNKETTRQLASCIDRLAEKEKMIISLYYVDNLNMSQIADVMEISQPRVSQLHAQAIRKLQKLMRE